jgi:4'-phosphopantetheinyl transferase
LDDKNIDLWIEPLTATDDEYQQYWPLLDEKEKAKAMRFIQKKHRIQYVVSHGKLRTILASYTGRPPASLLFTERVGGKPSLVIDGRLHEVKFNLSHTDNTMILAVGRDVPVGVDIEAWNNGIDFAAVAEEYFAETEAAFWRTLPAHETVGAFYRFWTRKESFVKAVGAGLSLDVSQVVTSVDGAARFMSLPSRYAAGQWQLVDLDLGPGISGALTVRAGHMDRLNFKSLLP